VKYTVTMRGHTFEVEIRGGEAWIDGEVVQAELHAIPGGPLRLLRTDSRVDAYALVRCEAGWHLYHGGDVWEARVVDERTRRLQEVTAGGRADGGHVTVKAPMPGLVLRVEVEAGTRVAKGQGLVVLEAMKMENELTAPLAGVVSAIHVRSGEAVAKGTPLVDVSSGVDRGDSAS
jgi:biotin carboxyl carrier protein